MRFLTGLCSTIGFVLAYGLEGLLKFLISLSRLLVQMIGLTLNLSGRFLFWFLYTSGRVLSYPFRRCFPPKNIDAMSGIDFEHFAARWLALGGYRSIKTTPKSNDYGIDLVAVKDGVKVGVQCKRYSGNVGVAAIQEVTAGTAYYNCEKGIVITNAAFTKNAVSLAAANGIELIDGAELRASRAAQTLVRSRFSLALTAVVMGIITAGALALTVYVLFACSAYLPLALMFLIICTLCLTNAICEIKARDTQDAADETAHQKSLSQS